MCYFSLSLTSHDCVLMPVFPILQVYSVINCIPIKINYSSWPLVIDFLSSVVETLFQKAKTNWAFISNVAIVTSTKQCLEIAKYVLCSPLFLLALVCTIQFNACLVLKICYDLFILLRST